MAGGSGGARSKTTKKANTYSSENKENNPGLTNRANTYSSENKENTPGLSVDKRCKKSRFKENEHKALVPDFDEIFYENSEEVLLIGIGAVNHFYPPPRLDSSPLTLRYREEAVTHKRPKEKHRCNKAAASRGTESKKADLSVQEPRSIPKSEGALAGNSPVAASNQDPDSWNSWSESGLLFERFVSQAIRSGSSAENDTGSVAVGNVNFSRYSNPFEQAVCRENCTNHNSSTTPEMSGSFFSSYYERNDGTYNDPTSAFFSCDTPTLDNPHAENSAVSNMRSGMNCVRNVTVNRYSNACDNSNTCDNTNAATNHHHLNTATQNATCPQCCDSCAISTKRSKCSVHTRNVASNQSVPASDPFCVRCDQLRGERRHRNRANKTGKESQGISCDGDTANGDMNGATGNSSHSPERGKQVGEEVLGEVCLECGSTRPYRNRVNEATSGEQSPNRVHTANPQEPASHSPNLSSTSISSVFQQHVANSRLSVGVQHDIDCPCLLANGHPWHSPRCVPDPWGICFRACPPSDADRQMTARNQCQRVPGLSINVPLQRSPPLLYSPPERLRPINFDMNIFGDQPSDLFMMYGYRRRFNSFPVTIPHPSPPNMLNVHEGSAGAVGLDAATSHARVPMMNSRAVQNGLGMYTDPRAVQNGLGMHSMDPRAVQNGLGMHSMNPRTVQNGLSMHTDPQAVQKGLGVHSLNQQTVQNSFGVNSMDPQTVQNGLGVHSMNQQTVQNGFGVTRTVQSTSVVHSMNQRTVQNGFGVPRTVQNDSVVHSMNQRTRQCGGVPAYDQNIDKPTSRVDMNGLHVDVNNAQSNAISSGVLPLQLNTRVGMQLSPPATIRASNADGYMHSDSRSDRNIPLSFCNHDANAQNCPIQSLFSQRSRMVAAPQPLNTSRVPLVSFSSQNQSGHRASGTRLPETYFRPFSLSPPIPFSRLGTLQPNQESKASGEGGVVSSPNSPDTHTDPPVVSEPETKVPDEELCLSPAVRDLINIHGDEESQSHQTTASRLGMWRRPSERLADGSLDRPSENSANPATYISRVSDASSDNHHLIAASGTDSMDLDGDGRDVNINSDGNETETSDLVVRGELCLTSSYASESTAGSSDMCSSSENLFESDESLRLGSQSRSLSTASAGTDISVFDYISDESLGTEIDSGAVAGASRSDQPSRIDMSTVCRPRFQNRQPDNSNGLTGHSDSDLDDSEKAARGTGHHGLASWRDSDVSWFRRSAAAESTPDAPTGNEHLFWNEEDGEIMFRSMSDGAESSGTADLQGTHQRNNVESPSNVTNDIGHNLELPNSFVYALNRLRLPSDQGEDEVPIRVSTDSSYVDPFLRGLRRRRNARNAQDRLTPVPDSVDSNRGTDSDGSSGSRPNSAMGLGVNVNNNYVDCSCPHCMLGRQQRAVEALRQLREADDYDFGMERENTAAEEEERQGLVLPEDFFGVSSDDNDLPEFGEDFPDLLMQLSDANNLDFMLQTVIERIFVNNPDAIPPEGSPVPATKSAIDSIETVRLIPEHIDQTPKCPICLCTLIVDEFMSRLGCGHIFHPNCVKSWLTKSNSCPVCRQSI